MGSDNMLLSHKRNLLLIRILQVATLPFCPESPKYLLLDKDDEMAANSGNKVNLLSNQIEVLT